MTDPPVVAGIDFGGSKIAVAVCDLSGNRLASGRVSTRDASPTGPDGARGIFERGVRATRELLATAAPGRDLAAVGVATFGIPAEDQVLLAPAIDGWESLALGRELRAAFPAAAVRMATDVKAAAAAEYRWGALRGCDPGVYLNLGTGLAAAIVAGGRVINGAAGAAGEIGYNLRDITDVGLALGQRVPLEDAVSGLGLARQLTARGLAQPAGTGPLSAADVLGPGRRDPDLTDLATGFVTELAFHLVNLAIVINPARIAVGGGMAGSWARLQPGLERALNAGVPFPPQLVLAGFPHEAPLIGAVALAVDAARDNQTGRDAPNAAADLDGHLRPSPAWLAGDCS
ncbi:MAG: ROK family protein [Streptosporangiaceae bacterium]